MFTFQCKHKFSAGIGKSVFYLMSMTNHIVRFCYSALLESLELEGTKFPKPTECASSKLKPLFHLENISNSFSNKL